MKSPTIIAIKYTAAGLIGNLIGALLIPGRSGRLGSTAAVFVCMLFVSTHAAYEQGKKDALPAGDPATDSEDADSDARAEGPDSDEAEHSITRKCTHCGSRILPKADGRCPSCNEPML